MAGDDGTRTLDRMLRVKVDDAASPEPHHPGADPGDSNGAARRAAVAAVLARLEDLSHRRTVATVARGVALVIAFGAVLWVVRPLRDGAFSADDIWLSQLPQQLAARHQSSWDYIADATRQWMDSQGRFFPGSIALSTWTFDIFTDRSDYKIWQIILVLLDIGIATAWIRAVTRDRWAPILAVLLFATVVQLRFFYDAIQHFGGQQGYVVAALFGTLLAVDAYMRKGRWPWLVLIAALWLVCITTYETTYLCLPVVWVASLHVPATWRRRAICASATLIPTILLGIFVLGLRATRSGPSNPAYTSNVDLGAVLPTFGNQIVGSLPLSQAWGVGHAELGGPFEGSPGTALGAIAVGLFSAVAVVAIWRARVSLRAAGVLAGAGLVLFLMPAAVVAITVRWQDGLSVGQAYIPAFLQSFGFVLLVLAGVACASIALRSWYQRWRPSLAVSILCAVVASVLVGSSIAAVAANNQQVISSDSGRRGWMAQQPELGWSRDTLVGAARAGLFDRRTAHGAIAAVPGGPWVNDDYVSYFAGHRVHIVNPWKFWTLRPGKAGRIPGCPTRAAGVCETPPKLGALLVVDATGYDQGIATIGRPTHVSTNSTRPMDLAIEVDGARSYIAAPGIDDLERPTVCAADSFGATRSTRGTRVVARGSGWVLVDLPRGLKLDPITVRLGHRGRCS